MTATGNGWYSYTFTNITSTNLIFNDGANQTADLSRNKTGWYLNNTWYDTDPGTPTGATWYQIVNRWQPTTYLYDGGNGQVKYGTSPAGTNTLYQWAKEDAGSGFIRLRNRSTGNYMHVEDQNGSVQCGTADPSWYSAMWTIPATGDGWNYIQNRWQTSEWIHIEGLLGYAQYSSPQTGWYSAMWQFVNPVTGTAITPQAATTSAATLDPGSSLISVQLYPNPAKGNTFYIALLPAGETTTITVHNLGGATLLQKQLTGSGQVLHHLAPGIYFVTILTKGVSTTKELIIE
jgi:hypothetical protein